MTLINTATLAVTQWVYPLLGIDFPPRCTVYNVLKPPLQVFGGEIRGFLGLVFLAMLIFNLLKLFGVGFKQDARGNTLGSLLVATFSAVMLYVLLIDPSLATNMFQGC